MFHMWCGGILCKENINRFHLTCLYCRWRRASIGKYRKPPYWITYTYLSQSQTLLVDSFKDGYNKLEYYREDGGKISLTEHFTLRIDPRGYFTSIRCAAIMVIDKIMKRFSLGKPFVELCELLANYP